MVIFAYMDLGIPLKGTHRAGIKVLKIAHLGGGVGKGREHDCMDLGTPLRGVQEIVRSRKPEPRSGSFCLD